jgi:hypothetical protein
VRRGRAGRRGRAERCNRCIREGKASLQHAQRGRTIRIRTAMASDGTARTAKGAVENDDAAIRNLSE